MRDASPTKSMACTPANNARQSHGQTPRVSLTVCLNIVWDLQGETLRGLVVLPCPLHQSLPSHTPPTRHPTMEPHFRTRTATHVIRTDDDRRSLSRSLGLLSRRHEATARPPSLRIHCQSGRRGRGQSGGRRVRGSGRSGVDLGGRRVGGLVLLAVSRGLCGIGRSWGGVFSAVKGSVLEERVSSDPGNTRGGERDWGVSCSPSSSPPEEDDSR